MPKKMGRPATPDYTKKIMRFSSIEKTFNELLSDLENEKERRIAEKLFKRLKEKVI